MKILKMVEKDMHTAMQRIHTEFGDEAMIVSNQMVANGVEVSFAIDDDIFLAPAPESQTFINSLSDSVERHTRIDDSGLKQPNSNIKMKAYLDELVEVSEINIKQAFNKLKPVNTAETESSGIPSVNHEESYSDSQQNPFAKPERGQFFDIVKRLGKRSLDNTSAANFHAEDNSHPDISAAQTGMTENNVDDEVFDTNEAYLQSFKAKNDAADALTSESTGDGDMHQTSHQSELLSHRSVASPTDNHQTLAQLSHSLQSVLLQNQRLEQQLWLHHREQQALPKAKDLLEKSPVLQKVFSQILGLGFDENTAWRCLEEVSEDTRVNQSSQFNSFDIYWRRAMQCCIQRLETVKHNKPVSPFVINSVHGFVGATGAGKTAALCKVAAQFCLDHVNKPLILLSYKQSRIAGFEELLYLADMLHVLAIDVQDAQSLKKIIGKYQNSHLILIDTGLENAALLYESLNTDNTIYETEKWQSRITCHWLIASDRSEAALKGQLHHFVKDTEAHGHCSLHITLSRVDHCERLATILQLLLDHNVSVQYLSKGRYLPKYYKQYSAKQLVSFCIKHYVLREKMQSGNKPTYSKTTEDSLSADAIQPDVIAASINTEVKVDQCSLV